MNSTAEIPSQWSHSIKLEETAKGIRISVHVYANNEQDAVVGALSAYLQTKEMLAAKEIRLAPFEVAKT